MFTQLYEQDFNRWRELMIEQIKEKKFQDIFGVRKPSVDEYPLNCPFTFEQLLNEDFYGQ